jgi:hypothetical protein
VTWRERFSIDIPVVVDGNVKGMKRFSFSRGTLPKVIVEHLNSDRVGNHALEVKENGISAIRTITPRPRNYFSTVVRHFDTAGFNRRLFAPFSSPHSGGG